MKVFNYLTNKKGIKETYDIYTEVRNLKAFAIANYKSSWEDALDEAFFHILSNYDSSKGDLSHYASKIVRTILLNKNKKEVANDEQTKIGLDLKAAEEYKSSSLELIFEDEKSEDIKKCIEDMVELYTKDLKFFVTENSKDRKQKYSKLFKKYSCEVIEESKKYLKDKYHNKAKDFVEMSKNTGIRNFGEDRYLKSIDSMVEYVGELNDIVMIRRRQGSHVKKVFKINIGEKINLLYNLLYKDDGYLTFNMEDSKVYLTLSGRFVNSVEELKNCLESELVGSLLSRTCLKVFHYDKGNELLLSSTKDIQYSVVLSIFGKNITIIFDRVVVKEVV